MLSPDKKAAEKDIMWRPDRLVGDLRRHGKDFSFSIRWAHRLQVNPNWGFRERVNEDGHLLWVLGGKGKYRVSEEEVSLERGTFVFVGPGVFHEAWADPKDPPFIIPVRFDILPLGSLGKGVLGGESFHRVYDHPNLLEALFEELHRQSMAMRGEFRKALCDSLIHSILSLAVLDKPKGARSFVDRRLEQARLRMSEEVPGPGVKELASDCHLSERHFSRVFTETFGLSPKEYRLSVMVDRARILLLEGEQSIAMIAHELGYRDAFSFSRQFKERMGASPLRWRKENK